MVLIPAIELGLLIEVGGQIGGFETMGLVVLTAAIGLHYVRVQGAFMPLRIQRGEIEPTQAAVEGAILSIGALALLIPGFVTDAIGFLCLLPPSRTLMGHYVLKRIVLQMTKGAGGDPVVFHVGHPNSSGMSGLKPSRGPSDDSIIVIKRKAPPSDAPSDAPSPEELGGD
jgi:UPF0716 protein FxsA